MRSHIGLLPQCLFIVRSRATVNRLKESYVSRAAQRPPEGAKSTRRDRLKTAKMGHPVAGKSWAKWTVIFLRSPLKEW